MLPARPSVITNLLAQFIYYRQFIRMTKYIYPAAVFSLVIIGSTLMVTSCSKLNSQPSSSSMLSQSELSTLIKRGKAPQVFGLTAYSTENGALFAGSYRLHKGQAGRIEFQSDKNSTTPIIGVNDNDQMMLIDSSSAESWISPGANIAMNGVVLKDQYVFEKYPRHVYETVGGMAVVVPKMTIDKIHIENAVFYMRAASGPLNMLTRWEKSSSINGVFGADFLRAFQFVRISLRNRYVFLSATSAYPPNEVTLTTVNTKDLQGGIGVDAMLDGEKKSVMIDLAGDFEVAISQPSDSKMRQISIGDAVFRQVEVVSGFEIGLGTNSVPRIGRQLLEKYDLVFNNFGKQLIIEIPKK